MTEDTLAPLIEWIQLYPTWAGVIVCIISFAESLVGIGFFVPGVLLMTAIGALVGHGALPLIETLSWAVLGAILGDGVSFWLGYRYKEGLRERWPFSRYPHWLARGQVFFQKHGGTSIILGRFIGPIRPIIPVIAGMMDMSPLKFYLFNAISALVWAPLYSLPGYLFGLSVGLLEPQVGRRLVLAVLLFGLALWLSYVTLSWVLGYIGKYLGRLLGPQKTVIGTGLFILTMFTLAGFWYAARTNPDFIATNEALWYSGQTLHTPELMRVAQWFAHFAEPYLLCLALSAWIALLMLADLRRTAWGWVTLTVGTAFFQSLLAWALEKPFWFDDPLWATTILGSLILCVPRGKVLLGIFWLLIFVSQLYVGVTFFHEAILAVWCGLAWVAIAAFVHKEWQVEIFPPNLTTKPWTWVCLLLGMVVVESVLLYKAPLPYAIRSLEWSQEVSSYDNILGEVKKGTLSVRQDVWGHNRNDFNVVVTGNAQRFAAQLSAQGWVRLTPTDMLNGLNWLNPKPKLLEHPDIPHYHRGLRETAVWVKALGDERLALRIWSTPIVVGSTHVLLGTVMVQEHALALPLIHVFRANKDFDIALSNLQKDFASASKVVTVAPLNFVKPKGWVPEMLVIEN